MWDCMSLEVCIFNLSVYGWCIYHFICIGSISILESKYSINDAVLTCISTGGPATTVTWTRDSEIIPDNDHTQVSVLDNSVTGQYTHTLNISGMTVPGVYGCSVSNNKPSSAKVVGTLNTEGTCIAIN